MSAAPAPQHPRMVETAAAVPRAVVRRERKRQGAMVLGKGHSDDPDNDDNNDNMM